MKLEDINIRGNWPPDHEFKQLFVELVKEHFKLKEELANLKKDYQDYKDYNGDVRDNSMDDLNYM